MSQTTQTAWPEGVIARYLSVGGATVDVRNVAVSAGTAACSGCQESEFFWRVTADCMGGPEHAREMNAEDARHWAQDHAETCRAMPRPTA